MASVFNSMSCSRMNVVELKPVKQFIPPEIISAIAERLVDQPFDLTATTSFITNLNQTKVNQPVRIDDLLISKVFSIGIKRGLLANFTRVLKLILDANSTSQLDNSKDRANLLAQISHWANKHVRKIVFITDNICHEPTADSLVRD